MNKISFIVGRDRGIFLQKELEAWEGGKKNWKLEVKNEDGIDWLYVEITDIGSVDALILFHAGVSAGFNAAVGSLNSKKGVTDNVNNY
jgi:hypothetical protein